MEFLSMQGVMDKIIEYLNFLKQEKLSGIISNFVQGALWERKVKEFGDKFVLPVFVYYDDFEINNALESHAGVNKIGGVYCSIPCIPPEHRSRVQNIFTLSLFNFIDRKTCPEGNDAIFQIAVDNCCLGLLLGDNEALNSSTGFWKGPNATFYCQLCKMTKNENQKNYCVEEKKYRTPEQYLSESFQDPKNTGVKENSI